MTRRRTIFLTFKRKKREFSVSALSSSLRALIPAAIVLSAATGRVRPAYLETVRRRRLPAVRLRANGRSRIEGI